MPEDTKSICAVFANGGIITKSSPDDLPITAYQALMNVATTRENSITVRRGFTRLNDGLPNMPISSYSLVDYLNRKWRYAVVDQTLYVAPIEDPTDASIWPLAYGTDFDVVTGSGGLSMAQDPRPVWATAVLYGIETRPYAFLADGERFLKHPGGLYPARRVGIPKPLNAISDVVVTPLEDELLEGFESYTDWTGGNSSGETAPHFSSAWWYGNSTVDARWYYNRYSFMLTDGSETFASGSHIPTYIPKNKAARAFWKTPESTYTIGSYASYGAGTVFTEAAGSVPAGARITEIRIRYSGYQIFRIQTIWQSSDGTITEGQAHGPADGDSYTFELDFDEYITGISGRYGDYINVISFTTNKRVSPEYGSGGDTDFSFDVPDGTATESINMVGFSGQVQDGRIGSIAMVMRHDTYDDAVTPPANATGWNLYVGTTADNLRKVNDDAIALTSQFPEPIGGFDFSNVDPLIKNSGDLSNDAAGETNNALKMTITGAGLLGRATKAFENDIGYPIVKDFGYYDPGDSFKISVKFPSQYYIDNTAKWKLTFVLSDIPGDTGSVYHYFASAEVTDFSGYSAGSWQEIEFHKSDFVYVNYGGGAWSGLGWNTVSAVQIDVVTKDDIASYAQSIVSFDNLYYSPVGKLTGSNYEWTYTYYNSRTDTESDYADLYENFVASLSAEQVTLFIPATPYTTPPLADPDKIKIYRLGGTTDTYRLVDTIDYLPGMTVEYIDNIADSQLGVEMSYDNQLPPDSPRGVVAYDGRLWTWGGSIDGIEEPKNRLRFSRNINVESFPTDSFIYCGPAEEILRAFEHDAELFVFTTVRVWRVTGSNGQYRAVSTPVNQGIMSIFGICRGLRSVYMRSFDGIYEFPAGRKISEPVNNVFVGGETIGGNPPVAVGQEWQDCLEFRDSKLYFSYASDISGSGPTASNDRMMVFDTLYERWSTYLLGAFGLHTEPETNYLVASTVLRYGTITDGIPGDLDTGGPYPIRLEDGYVDQAYDLAYGGDVTFGIPYEIDTKEYDLGMADQEKRIVDFVLDADLQGATTTIEIARDPVADTPGMHESLGNVTSTGRTQQVLQIPNATGNSSLCRRMSLRLYGVSLDDATSQLTFYKMIHRFLMEPGRHRAFVTAWDLQGCPTPKFFRELWLDVDTFGHELDSVEVQLDQQVAQVIAGSGDDAVPFLQSNGRGKLFLALDIDLRGTLARLKLIPSGDNEVKLYDYSFQMIPEPPVIVTFQASYSDESWTYNKLWKEVVLDIDTIEKPIRVSFWLDGVVKDQWEITTTVRREVTHSLQQDLVGKLGRITIEETYLDECDEPNGFRYYQHRYVVDQLPPDVTIADTYIQTMNFDRVKVLKRLWLTIKNPDADVQIEIYMDGKLKVPVKVLPADPMSTGYSKRRIDLESGCKGMLCRIVLTSTCEFEVHPDKSAILAKGLNPDDTYQRVILTAPQTY